MIVSVAFSVFLLIFIILLQDQLDENRNQQELLFFAILISVKSKEVLLLTFTGGEYICHYIYL